jgi:hypothetical protein
MGSSRHNRLVGALIAGSMVFTSTAAVAASAPATPTQINPWVALTALSGGAPAAALCGAAAAAAAAQGPATGCVLPVNDVAPPIAQAPPPQPIPVPPVESAGGGLAFDPLLLALGALAVGALVFFLVRHHHHASPA